MNKLDRPANPINLSSPTTARGIEYSQAEFDAGLRSFMMGVYNHMILGLAITGLTALGVSMAAANNPDLAGLLYGSPLAYVIMLAPLAFVFFFSFRVDKMSVQSATMTFFLFSALMGLSLSSIFLVFAGESIARTLFITAAAFGSLSMWGYTTKRDISGWGAFLLMGLIGVILAAVVNLFLGASALGFAVSVVALLVFSGLTAWDTQRLKNMYIFGDMTPDQAAKMSIMGALSLYLNFVNIFISLLNLTGSSD